MKKTAIFGFVAAMAVAGVGCGPDTECHDSLWIQVDNTFNETLRVAVTTPAPICDGEGHVAQGATEIDAPTNLAEFGFPYLPADPQAGNTVVFTVLSEGTLKDKAQRCTISERGIELTYARLWVDPVGNMHCTCGFEENTDPDLCA